MCNVVHRLLNIVHNITPIRPIILGNTGVHSITTFRSTTNCIYDGGPVRLYYYIILHYIILYYIILYYIILYYIILYYIILYYIILYYIIL